MFGIGPLELALLLMIVLVLFGARRLPEMGRSLGSGMREFKEGIMHPSADEEDSRSGSNVSEFDSSHADKPRSLSN
jgi:sec-independent protein translocase protein TatA